MELTPPTVQSYLRHAFDQMLAVAERLGEPAVNQRPLGPHTNSVAALVVHCCGVTEHWLGHVALGRASNRDRESEFRATATLPELRQLVEATVARAVDDLALVEAGGGREHEARSHLPGGDRSDTAVVLHVLEELFQHLGHMELAADALRR